MRTDVLKGLIYPNKDRSPQADTNFASVVFSQFIKDFEDNLTALSLSTHVKLWTLTFSLDDPENLSALSPKGVELKKTRNRSCELQLAKKVPRSNPPFHLRNVPDHP